jgi:hypothetical protein
METYGVTRQTAYSYCRKVEKEWQENAKPTRNYQRHVAVRTLDRAIEGCMEDRRWSAVGPLVGLKAKLLGLFEPEVLEVSAPGEHPTATMTSPQLRAFIKEAHAKREALLAQVLDFGN